jgi:hypothetical protein
VENARELEKIESFKREIGDGINEVGLLNQERQDGFNVVTCYRLLLLVDPPASSRSNNADD